MNITFRRYGDLLNYPRKNERYERGSGGEVIDRT